MLLIRHAEKDEASAHLNPEGRHRTEALPCLVRQAADRPDLFPRPDFIFATKQSAHSDRPVEAVTPLAKALRLDIDARFANDQYTQLADELLTDPRYAGRAVLVCWHHGSGTCRVDTRRAPDGGTRAHRGRVTVALRTEQGLVQPRAALV